MTELWQGQPLTITVDPAGMTLHSYDEEKVRKIKDDYKDVKILSATHLKKEWERRWKDAKIVEIEGFDGSVEILEWGGDVLASFSGSDEYSGHVNAVWKITVKTHKGEKTWQLWTSYRGG
uniref:Uncharacterized protein n=1 Tax=viral metagenome TaxID=1070528 RepID=A0A6M3LWA5_9ZZZZ